MNVKRILIASVIIWIISTAYGWLTCGCLFNWVYELEPTRLWETPEAIQNHMIWINSLGLLTAIIFVSVYALLYKGIPGKGIKKGICFGLIIWLIGTFSGLITMPFYMTIATTVVIYWIISHFVLSLIIGAIIGIIYKEK
ncbi:MAG: hypothetical protein CVT95_12695 [Bacteroidetes bacterium HGW-Bacteroidetes-12]|nr:MAG: hypothetical protein CVT95_12695 [Bacteroidetes bacterium HGW-Bacteroidetes-12]